jgi:hypothetical protein
MTNANSPSAPSADTAVEVIQVPNTLRMKVGSRFGGIDPSALAKAEAALKGLSSQFAQWLQDEIGKLEASRTAIRVEGLSQQTADRLYINAHDLKGLGATYEFPLITRIAASLCTLMDHPPSRPSVPMFLVDAHIDAVRACVRDDIRDVSHPVGRILAEELERRVRAHLGENGRA